MKKFPNLRKFVIVVIAMFLSTAAFSQFTRQQAINLVINTIIGADSAEVLVYCAYNSYNQQQPVELFDNRTVSCPFSNNWVFFIDDDLAALWYHPCRFIFVCGQNGNYDIVNEDLYPQDIETDYELISLIPNYNPITFPDYTGDIVLQEEPNDHLFAVLIGGSGTMYNRWQWYDISLVYNTLLSKGYKKENIYVHFAENDDSYGNGETDDLDGFPYSDDIDYNASIESVEHTFEYLAQNLGHDDQLLVHLDAHGNTNLEGTYITIIGVPGVAELLYDYQLAEWLEPIDCAQMMITIMSCLSGGFIDDLTDYTTYTNPMCKNRQIYTASRNYESAHFERHITIGYYNYQYPYNVYGEFVFYFYSALWGYYPDVDIWDGDITPWLPSYNVSEFPFNQIITFISPYPVHDPDYNPDEVLGNNDGFTQIGEAFAYMDDLNTYSHNGYFNNYLPNMQGPDYPQFAQTELFDADVLTLTGLRGNVYNDAIVSGNFMLSGDITIEETADVEIENSCEFYFLDENVVGSCRLIIDGIATIGSNVSFQTEGDQQVCLQINNTTLNLTLDQATFLNGKIVAYNNLLTVSNSSFANSSIDGYYGNFDITSSQFNSSFVHIANAFGNNKLVNISDECSFTGPGTTAIEIDNYPDFKMDFCNIKGYYDAIDLYNCGYGSRFQQVSNCDITDNTNSGITVYRTSVDILDNIIYNNGFGIKCYDRSVVHIEGDNQSITQEIKDNTWNEVYASRGSFPQYFHWNLVRDDDNMLGDPLVKYTGSEDGLDVRNNCWGYNFNWVIDLEPSNSYIWNPVWQCMQGAGSGSGSEAEALYLDARENIENENFAVAKADFEQILDEYPETEYAKAAMKELYPLEEITGNNYSNLKEYYHTHTAIQSDPELTKLADFLANFCDIKLENYPTAIAWFEDVIQNPESMEDSIFAIIDLGYTYFLMENGQKSSYVGNMPQYKPVTVDQFEVNRDYLLSLLPGDNLSETMKENINALKTGELLQNVPNPFNNTTQIWYKLDEEAMVAVNVFDYTGKRVSTINPGKQDKGSHFVEFSSVGLPAGIYFYSLEVNGRVSDSKKMTVMK